MSLRCEEVDDACRDDDANGEDDVSEDVDVGCLNVDIVLEGISRRWDLGYAGW